MIQYNKNRKEQLINMNISHFGINIREKASNHINKEAYLAAKPEGMRGWEEEHYASQKLKADLNYDLNMRFFESLNLNDFNRFVNKKCKKHKFTECFDLNELSGTTGLYMMVLDNYKQVYIGISTDIKSRIISHWNRTKSLERLIFGDLLTSIIAIDCFGALDTTRIFYIETKSLHKLEQKIVKDFEGPFLINRTSGGIGSKDTNTADLQVAIFATLAGKKTKNLIPFVTLKELKCVLNEKQLQFYFDKYPELKKSSK